MPHLVFLLAFLLAAALFVTAGRPGATAAAAQEPEAGAWREIISGRAVALDGDTLLIDGQRVRLFGIDAPEMRDWPWGAYARAALDGLIGQEPVACGVFDSDRHKRPVARCYIEAQPDLGAAMIARGWAVPYRIFTHGAKAPAGLGALYDAAEAEARKARRGIWRDYGGG